MQWPALTSRGNTQNKDAAGTTQFSLSSVAKFVNFDTTEACPPLKSRPLDVSIAISFITHPIKCSSTFKPL